MQFQDRYLVLCSDGIFEFMSNLEIIKFVDMMARRGHKPSSIANFLVGLPMKLHGELAAFVDRTIGLVAQGSKLQLCPHQAVSTVKHPLL